MCGITGAFGHDAHLRVGVVEAMNDAQLERGPDHPVVADGPFVLGDTRLAIQDPTPSAHQRFRDSDGRFTVVFYGEIYNVRELVRQYGLDMRTRCDGEIIPLLWAKLGPSCLSLFRGMLTRAVADQFAQSRVVARDPFRIKPLHWRRYGAGVLFASDVTPLCRVDRNLPVEQRAVGDFLHFGAVAADRSPFAGIEAVPPGACVRIGMDGLVPPELVVPAFGPGSSRDEVAVSEDRPLAEALRSSVQLHLLADVTTALLLSAGVDPASLAQAARDEGQSLHCLTITAHQGEDESPQAMATAAESGHTHETVAAEIDDGAVEALLSVMPRPTIDGLNNFLVNRAVRAAGYKVALCGLDGDEELGGYRYTRMARFLPVLGVIGRIPGEPAPRLAAHLARRGTPGTHSGKLERLLRPGGQRTLGGPLGLRREVLSADRVRSLLGSSEKLDGSPPAPGRRPVVLAPAEMFHYLQPMRLADADAFSMAPSVELRVPFVDGPFSAAALNWRHLRGKRELVHQMGDHYLDLLSRRKKSGFSEPMQVGLRSGSLRQVVADAASSDAPVWDHLDRAGGLPILATAGEAPRWSEAWALAALDGWLRRR